MLCIQICVMGLFLLSVLMSCPRALFCSSFFDPLPRGVLSSCWPVLVHFRRRKLDCQHHECQVPMSLGRLWTGVTRAIYSGLFLCFGLSYAVTLQNLWLGRGCVLKPHETQLEHLALSAELLGSLLSLACALIISSKYFRSQNFTTRLFWLGSVAFNFTLQF